MVEPVTKGWVRSRGAALALGVSPETIAQWVRKGILVGYMPISRHYADERPRKGANGSKLLVSVASIEALLEKQLGRRIGAGLLTWRKVAK